MARKYILVIRENLFKRRKFIFNDSFEDWKEYQVLKESLKEEYIRSGKHAHFLEYVDFGDMKMLSRRYDT